MRNSSSMIHCLPKGRNLSSIFIILPKGRNSSSMIHYLPEGRNSSSIFIVLPKGTNSSSMIHCLRSMIHCLPKGRNSKFSDLVIQSSKFHSLASRHKFQSLMYYSPVNRKKIQRSYAL